MYDKPGESRIADDQVRAPAQDEGRKFALVRPLHEQIKTRLASEPDNDRLLSTLSYLQALLGDHDGAMASVEHLLSKVPSYPLRMQNFIRANAGIVCGWVGEKDKAVDLLQPLLNLPSPTFNSVFSMHNNIDYFPLRGFPRWEAALADPANRQPFKY